jgi:hypothetical protein
MLKEVVQLSGRIHGHWVVDSDGERRSPLKWTAWTEMAFTKGKWREKGVEGGPTTPQVGHH